MPAWTNLDALKGDPAVGVPGVGEGGVLSLCVTVDAEAFLGNVLELPGPKLREDGDAEHIQPGVGGVPGSEGGVFVDLDLHGHLEGLKEIDDDLAGLVEVADNLEGLKEVADHLEGLNEVADNPEGPCRRRCSASSSPRTRRGRRHTRPQRCSLSP